MKAIKNKMSESFLPPQDMPEDWYDDERMNFLFSIFKDRSLNPISYDAKMKFWKTHIIKYCIHKKIICIDDSKLKKAFERKDRFPACLQRVLEELKRDGKVAICSDLTKNGYKGQSWAAWTKEMVVAKPASFAASKLWSALGYEETVAPSITLALGDSFVCLDALKVLAEAMLHKYCGDIDSPQAASPAMELPTVLKGESGTRQEAELCIIYLCQQGKAIVDETTTPPLVKFGNRANISEVDRQSQKLKQQEAALAKRLQEMESIKTKYEDEARDYLKKNMRPAAKSSLRKKREVETRIEKLVDAMTNLHLLMLQVEDTESNAQVVDSYKTATAALKSTFKETGLSEDNVANTMDQVEEVLELHDDVRTLISQPVGVATTPADDELEQELADLLAEPEVGEGGDGGHGGEEEEVLELPDVPNFSPSSSVQAAL